MRVCVTGAGGFIASHLGKRLLEEGHYVIAVDLKKNEFMEEKEFCSEFKLLDLRDYGNCLLSTNDCEWVYNLAADMGGMGYIQSNNAVILYNNTMISFNMLEASRRNGVKRFFYSSSACVYPEEIQTINDREVQLKEADAWPAHPQDSYGLEKLVTEELCLHYQKDFGIQVRIARFHNIYGPYSTWRGGREKSPAAFCRKVIASPSDGGEVDIWGSGRQTRSYCYIDDCVEGIVRIMNSDYSKPLNLGSDYSITMDGLHELVCSFENKKIAVKHVPGPEGVGCRNSDNTLIREVLDWEPRTDLEDGMRILYSWIKGEMEKEPVSSSTAYTQSVIVG